MKRYIYIILYIIGFLNFTISYSQETSKPATTQRIIEPIDPDCEEYEKYAWFYDNDGDGAGDPNYSQMACSKPPGKWVSNNNDCNDNNIDITYYVWYYDKDHDGFGDPNYPAYGCNPPTDYVANNLDCDDNNKDINPNTKWYLDTNGDGIVSDLDGSPIISCTKPTGNYYSLAIDKNNHWIHETTYDIKGKAIGASRTYFDNLAKPNVSLVKDFAWDKVWGTETIYDNFGRPDKTSFIAPSPLNTFEKTNFLKSNAEAAAGSSPTSLPLTNITSSNNYKATQTITANGIVSSGLNVTLTAPSIILSDGFSITATTGSAFKATAAYLSDNSANSSLANYYSDNNTDEPYQATATHPFSQMNYDSLDPENAINVVGGNKINGEWKTGYSYTVPAAQEMYYVYGTSFFDTSKDIELYVSKKEYPQYDNFGLSAYFLKIITSESNVLAVESIPGANFNIMMQLGAYSYAVKANSPLERGKLYKMIINGETKIVQVFNEISYRNTTGINNIDVNNPLTILAGSWNTFSEINTLNQTINVSNDTNNLIVDLKCAKTISIDANGVENVSFTDIEGKILATAKSGGTLPYLVKSLIGPQGYVDIHLPIGCGGSINFLGNSSLYNVYDLKTGSLVTSKSNIPSGVYRIELTNKPISALGLTYINKTNKSINNVVAEDLGVTYNVNYYDYAVNIYNKTGQLTKSIQPNGYTNNTSIVDSPSHMASTNFSSTYSYNSLGQLTTVNSSDEGISNFVYRKDGNIRYSQNALQAKNSQVSYTNYDGLGRPIESGVITDAPGVWTLASTSADTDVAISTNTSERLFAIYDYPENITNDDNSLPTPYSLTIPSSLSLATLAPSLTNSQKNLSGNLAITYKADTGNTINSITWYSYDSYGRTEWIAQYTDGIGIKTTYYEYDHNGNIKRTLFQKGNASEQFVHQYTYDSNNGKLTTVQTATSLSPENFTTHADYTYYKTGELKRINIGQGTQGLDYVYTLGGQLKSINHPSLEASKDPGGDSNDVFGLTLDYYPSDYLRTGRNITSSPTAGADYNGNIKAARWTNKGFNDDFSGGTAKPKAYLYSYNRNNWLSNATYGSADPNNAIITPSGSYKEGDLTYDPNGNILTMKRSNAVGNTQDDLNYGYYSGKNQLNYVKDNITNSPTNSADLGNQNLDNYKYDEIGQLTQNISENLKYLYTTQGLVSEIQKDNHTLVKFLYNERGHLVKKENYATANPYGLDKTTFYAVELSGNALAIYNFSNSGVLLSRENNIYGLSRLGNCNSTVPNVFNYEITDHLGNVRAIVRKPSSGNITQSSIDYYPFGEQLPGRSVSITNSRYAFQGQELDQAIGMETFQLRLWDGRLGRWLNPDPQGEFASPYLGMGNNPIYFVDKAGDTIRPYSQKDFARVQSLKQRLASKDLAYFNMLENLSTDIYISYDNTLKTYMHNNRQYSVHGQAIPVANSHPNFDIIPNDLRIGNTTYGPLSYSLITHDSQFPLIKNVVNTSNFNVANDFFINKMKYKIDRVNIQMKNGIEANPLDELETAFHELGHAEFYIKNPFSAWIWNIIDQYDLANGAGHGTYNPNGLHAREMARKASNK
ncbi:hypothetical protein LPB248_08480 [Flavobacterium sp. LPB0248]|uniref:RHS repeat domain-containing protein n=1 Tax=Flavobacterium sp. LPB0248 TaxID=2614441 RepID=UPI0015A6A9D2|nr:RHS repeat-associated core domain-containing protein [Flavobacterium sp. LPB0248]QLC66317.1 hypothetical protein LPB248_08480 [Flavobacterium sp. LPB0248]